MATFGASSYAILGALYVLLTAMLLTSWRGRKIGAYLIAACVISAVWSGLMAWEISRGGSSRELIFLVEVLRAGAWLTFLAQAGLARNIRLVAYAGWVLVLLTGSWVWASNQFLGTVGDINTVAIPGGLATSLIGLVVIEQLYRNAPAALRSSAKALAIGLGGVFAYDLFLYSQGVLFNEIDTSTWMARGAVNVLFVPFIALAARRNPDWDLNIFVSRQIVFYSTALVAVGIYLLAMSLGGYLLLLYGGTWGSVARVVFFAGAALVLIALLFSSVLRAKVRVFLNKHFFQNKYDYREEWLRLVASLAEFESSSTRHVVIRAMAQIVESPAGILWTRNSPTEDFAVAATYETDDRPEDISVDDPLVRFIRKNGWIIDLRELTVHPDRYQGLELPDWVNKLASGWLIVPLVSRNELVGLMLLCEAPNPFDLNYEDRDLLKTVGNHIAVHLVQEQSDTRLAHAQQFEAYNRLTAFLMHDLKNLTAQQALIVENAERHKGNPEFIDDAIETVASGVKRLRRVVEHLRQTSVAKTVERVEVGKLVLQAVSECQDRSPTPRGVIGDRQTWVQGDRDRLFMALVHAIRNAQDATPDDGSIEVLLGTTENSVTITITDTGAGMDEAFVRERLFKPFDSTKGTQGVGIGAYQIKETVRSVGGRVRVRSSPGSGTELTFLLSAAPEKV